MWKKLKQNYAELISLNGLNDMLRLEVGFEFKETETKTNGEL